MIAMLPQRALTVLDRTIGTADDWIVLVGLQHAEAMTLATFRKLSGWQRLMERGANLVRRLL